MSVGALNLPARLEIKGLGGEIQTPRSAAASPNNLNGDFTALPKTLNMRDKLGLSAPAKFGQVRGSTTPSDVSVSSVILILQECAKGISNLTNHIPGLDKALIQVTDIKVPFYTVIVSFTRRRTHLPRLFHFSLT